VSERDPDQLADELEDEADKLKERTENLGDELQDVRQDWERKRADESVPGAVPPDSEDSDAGAETNEREGDGGG
jgi:hypothetical protein